MASASSEKYYLPKIKWACLFWVLWVITSSQNRDMFINRLHSNFLSQGEGLGDYQPWRQTCAEGGVGMLKQNGRGKRGVGMLREVWEAGGLAEVTEGLGIFAMCLWNGDFFLSSLCSHSLLPSPFPSLHLLLPFSLHGLLLLPLISFPLPLQPLPLPPLSFLILELAVGSGFEPW